MVSNPDLIQERQEQDLESQDLQSPTGELHLRFHITSGHELALPAASVREVLSLSPDRITPIPNTSSLLLGTINFRGQAVWVVDLGQFIGYLEPLSTDRSEISVITVEDQAIIAGLAVERITGTDWLEPDQTQATTHIPDNMAPFLKGGWLVDAGSNQWLHLLDPATILCSQRWVA